MDVCAVCLKLQGLDQKMRAKKMSKKKIEAGN